MMADPKLTEHKHAVATRPDRSLDIAISISGSREDDDATSVPATGASADAGGSSIGTSFRNRRDKFPVSSLSNRSLFRISWTGKTACSKLVSSSFEKSRVPTAAAASLSPESSSVESLLLLRSSLLVASSSLAIFAIEDATISGIPTTQLLGEEDDEEEAGMVSYHSAPK